jgi:hypothetical protein
MKNRTSMGNWKKKLIQKKGRGSQTTGKSKGIVATALQKSMCRRNRSYKHPNYGVIMDSIGVKRTKKGL